MFTRTKHGADKLARALEARRHRRVAIHGNKSQSARTRALAEFKDGDGAGAGRHRHRRARHRHRPAAARGQLRPAERAGGLRAPHRPHRPRRRRPARRSRWCASTRHAFLRDIERLIKRDDPARGRRGLRARSQCGRAAGVQAARAAVAASKVSAMAVARRDPPAATARKRAATAIRGPATASSIKASRADRAIARRARQARRQAFARATPTVRRRETRPSILAAPTRARHKGSVVVPKVAMGRVDRRSRATAKPERARPGRSQQFGSAHRWRSGADRRKRALTGLLAHRPRRSNHHSLAAAPSLRAVSFAAKRTTRPLHGRGGSAARHPSHGMRCVVELFAFRIALHTKGRRHAGSGQLHRR